jgi:hypothetical protein
LAHSLGWRFQTCSYVNRMPNRISFVCAVGCLSDKNF